MKTMKLVTSEQGQTLLFHHLVIIDIYNPYHLKPNGRPRLRLGDKGCLPDYYDSSNFLLADQGALVILSVDRV